MNAPALVTFIGAMNKEDLNFAIRTSSFNKVIAFSVVLLILYTLGSGPVWWLHKQGIVSIAAYRVIYNPILPLIEDSPDDLGFRYVNWWSPVIEF